MLAKRPEVALKMAQTNWGRRYLELPRRWRYGPPRSHKVLLVLMNLTIISIKRVSNKFCLLLRYQDRVCDVQQVG
jgi:hypothetical protein